MTPNEIKAFFVSRGLSLSAVALAIGEDRSCVSRVVNYVWPGARIRKKLKRKYPGLWFKPWKNKSGERRAA